VNPVIGILMGLTLASCVTMKMGRDFDPAVFRTFEVDKTTTAQVLASVGEPWMQQTLPDGVEVWTYLSTRTQAIAIPVPFYTHVETDGTTKSITLTFRDGVLTRAAYPARPTKY
jgi:hypothetical protein